MKRRLSLFAATLLLAGCGNSVGMPAQDTSLREHLRNPLYAEYYYDDLTQLMVNLALQEDPILEDAGIRNIVDRTRTRSLEHANLATDARYEGFYGLFLTDRDLVLGDALLLDDVLSFGPTFDAAPGPSLQVYLTTEVDPRDVEFPDSSAVHLGQVKNQYGAQSFSVPRQGATGSGARLRTAVLWDDDLGLLYGFAQLTKPTR